MNDNKKIKFNEIFHEKESNKLEDTELSENMSIPHSINAERGVICGLLIDPKAFEIASIEGLSSSDFYHPSHIIIFSAIEKIQADFQPINTITLSDKLISMQQLNNIGGITKIAQLETLLPTSAHIEVYCKIIIEKSNLRKLINIATNIIKLAKLQKENTENVIDKAEQNILAIRNKSAQKDMHPIKYLVKKAMENILEIKNNKNHITGINSGFFDFDKLTNGFQPGELIIIAARPSMGKTAFTLNIAANIAINEKLPVAFFSLEMSSEQLIQRLVASESKINLSDLRKGEIGENESSRLTYTYGKLSEASIFIDESPILNISNLRSKCRRLIHHHKVKIIIIDYLQLMNSNNHYENKTTEISEISKGLKSIAREFKVPIIALSQLNRGVESRIDKRPMMSDLRDSGAIEQDADIVTFLYREEYYLKDRTPRNKLGLTEIIISKNRNGPTGDLKLKFINNITRFMNLDQIHDNTHF